MGSDNCKPKLIEKEFVPKKKETITIHNSNVPKKYNDPKSLKISFLGKQAVGKSRYYHETLYNDKEFPDKETEAEGSFCLKNVEIENHGKVLAVLLDLAGNEDYFPITKSLLQDSNAVLLIYAIDESSSFDRQKTFWIAKIEEILDLNYDNVHLIGNKVDLAVHDRYSETPGVPLTSEERKKKGFVTYEDGLELARQNGFLFAETSAITGYNLSKSLKDLMKANLDLRKSKNFNEIYKDE